MVRQHTIETVWTVSLAEVQPTDCVLEIGFGAGEAIALLAEHTTQGSVAGIELSPTMVKRAGVRNAHAVGAGRVTLHQGNAEQLPFEEQRFDKVVSIHTYYFWADPHAILTEVFRVLKPGGKLIFTLATRIMGEREETGLGAIIAEHVLPQMRSIGFAEVASRYGPLSRQFRILAVIGAKPADVNKPLPG
jgi:ubiquinone/menaquinone biosynthesis C-methylase UbiE